MRREPIGKLLSRAAALRCPRCGNGKLFAGWFRMHRACAECRLHYEPDPGYYLGATYINYAVTALILTAAYVSLRFAAGFENRMLMPFLLAFVVLFPLASFRHARALWLAFDFYIDAAGWEERAQPPDESESP